jgi:hypothetical protein
MKISTIRVIGAGAAAMLWLALSVFAWLRPADLLSESERRKLEQFPKLSVEEILSGKFMSNFEKYTLDQFPLRDSFRQMKALFHYHVLQQGDNNGIYILEGQAAQLEYPLNQQSVDHARKVFGQVYEKYLADTGSKIFLSVIPDKSYYLAQQGGYPAMDYTALFAQMRQGMPWATYVDLTQTLDRDSYYQTDTHWRQEKLLPAAQKLSVALNIPAPRDGDFALTAASRPFYGVYYGQAALPMQAETLYMLQNDMLKDCTVYNYETGKTTGIYDESKLSGNDLYEVFLSGPVSLLTIENPHAQTDRELIVFRDSFGSSLAPLLTQGYAKITLVDIRYISSAMLDRFVEFNGQDVLFLYSTLVLNNSSTIK